MPDNSAAPEATVPARGTDSNPKDSVEKHFNFIEHNTHHTSHYSAIEYVSGSPNLILNLASYADSNYDRLDLEVANLQGQHAMPTVAPETLQWAQDYVAKHPGHEATEFSKVMTVANHDSTFGSLPRILSFLDHQTFWSTIALLLLSATMLIFARRRPTQYKPTNGVQHALEALVLFVRDDIVRPSFPHGDQWTPFFASIFLAILACNLFGIIPLFATATGNIGATLAFSAVIFILMMVLGLKANGPVHFWFNIIPVKWSWKPMDMFVFLLLMVLEWLSLITRPLILAVRLFANMLAGHTLLLVFLSLGFIYHESSGSVVLAHGLGVAGWFLAIPFYGLEVLVAFIQAYIFTLLSVIFIVQCSHPEH
jgi:F-type H+-transporting ATPase subunit a